MWGLAVIKTMENMLKIALFGPQGSGKGTQAKMLSTKYNLPILATGDIFREEIKQKTELGKKVSSLLDSGALVPDEVVDEVVGNELKKDKYKNGFILDGYPRNIEQFRKLKERVELSHVIELKIADSKVIDRLASRRTCSLCAAIYSLKIKPPKQDGICDSCKGALMIRDDDKPEAIKKRLDIYHGETKAILDNFEENKIIQVDGSQTIENVFEDIVLEIEK